jgi:C-terminal processing protease CtpA/Prc
MKKLIFLPIIFLAFFASCKKDPIVPVVTEMTDAMARDTTYYIMKEFYLWYSLMPIITKEDYKNPYDILEAMRYKTLDRWSYILTGEEYNNQVNGVFVGHGFRIGLDNTGKARIAMIYNNSALYLHGVRRGWIVKKINGVDVAAAMQSTDPTAYSNMIGPSEAGITNIFEFQKPDGTLDQFSATKAPLNINTVLNADTIKLSNGEVTGHLVFESFFPPAKDELATAFAKFNASNIKNLVLDLRYNSGGQLDLAQTLASYIAGNSRQGTVFATLTYNNKNQIYNRPINFVSTTYPLALSKLVVITSRSTASASEDVINGLRPYFDIVTIGDTTNGKPTGMNGFDPGNLHKYYIFPVTFKIVNSAGQGDFYDGFAPKKVLSDDITRDWNDKNEACFKEAIHYLETGSVSTKSSTVFKRYPHFSEKPAWMDNAIVMWK